MSCKELQVYEEFTNKSFVIPTFVIVTSQTKETIACFKPALTIDLIKLSWKLSSWFHYLFDF